MDTNEVVRHRRKVTDHYAGPYIDSEEKTIVSLVKLVAQKLQNLETFVGQYNNEVPVKRRRTAGGLSRRIGKLHEQGRLAGISNDVIEEIELYLSREGAEQVAKDKEKRKITISAQPVISENDSDEKEVAELEYLLNGVKAKKLSLDALRKFLEKKNN